MRPRSRLLSKRRLLLPTIREGTEETLRDLNETNTLQIAGHGQAVSSEDYLLSICHLAHPTFPTRDVSSYNIQQLDCVHQRLRLSRFSETTSTTFEFNSTEEAHAIDMQQGEGKELNGELMLGSADPLEYLYGHQNNLSGGVRREFVEERCIRQHGSTWEGQAHSRAHSISHASSPDLQHQRKCTCPELHSSTNTSIPNVSPKHNLSRLEARGGSPADRGAEGERQNPTMKTSLISQWISDCRLAWREARVRACLLPAIAEI